MDGTGINKEVLDSKENELLEIERDIEDIDPKILDNAEPDIKELLLKTMTVMQSQSVHRSGPLPSPEDLDHYNNIIPDGANRIMQMAEDQLKHRLIIEKSVVSSNNNDSRNGQLFGFILSLICIGSSVYLGINNKEVLAGVIATTTIIGLITTFVLGKKFQFRNEDSKEENSDETDE
ncbi:DUF2335 domain-containing protein [Empedobacter brevis]|uniref:DUF2335 domain-containing protein n=1 Tax=Empedobacter brevis TaxID=247 RepID=UPI00123C9872|nr:DUF2335 domain-containing protein [Empedobacter brevis]QES93109.1 DUF2335 domain-containing protein [Empedobacter brevis]